MVKYQFSAVFFHLNLNYSKKGVAIKSIMADMAKKYGILG